MKKILLPIIITGLFSTSVFALAPATETSNINMEELMSEIQSASETGALNNQKEEKKSKIGRTLLKRAIQYKAIKTVVKNPRKTLIAGAAVGGLGYYGYYKMKKELFKQKMAKHELFEQEWQNMIDYYPDEWEALLKRVEYDIEHSDDEEHVENLEKFLDFVVVSAKTEEAAKEIREALNSNSKHIVDSVEAMFNEVEEDFNKTGKKCTVNDLKNLIDENYDFSSYSSVMTKNKLYSVSSYKNLKRFKKQGYEDDHIPSYKAIENFLIEKGISLPLQLTQTQDEKDKGLAPKIINKTKSLLNKSIKTDRLKVLENNTTVINVYDSTHVNGRTYLGRNRYLHSKDASNLKNATIQDISFALYNLKKHNLVNDYNQYLQNSVVLIKRNFELCLYQ